jgi:uncharacterized integral membrane protein
MKPKMIAILVSGCLFLIVLLQNTQVVSLRFFFWQISMSRIILFPLVMFIGFIIGIFVGRTSRNKKII